MDHQTFASMLGNYGEFVGAIGVIVTLGYLAIQMKQNTAQLRSDSYQRHLDNHATHLREVCFNPEVAMHERTCVRRRQIAERIYHQKFPVAARILTRVRGPNARSRVFRGCFRAGTFRCL